MIFAKSLGWIVVLILIMCSVAAADDGHPWGSFIMFAAACVVAALL